MKYLNLHAPINNLGYGIVSNGLCHALQLQGVTVSLFPIGIPTIPSEKYRDNITRAIECAKNFKYSATCLKIYHQFDLATRIASGPYLAYPFFELDNFTPQEIHHLCLPDTLIVSSRWARDIVSQRTNRESVVVSPGVDTYIFTAKQLDSKPNFVFLNVGKWEKRKGHDVLAKCFSKAFTRRDNVELWMMPTNPFLPDEKVQEWKRLYNNSELGFKIKILPHQHTHNEVAHIMKQADCGVFPSRAEGWNLELLEMMACGQPVIATNYSAHTEFCHSNNAYLIDIDNTESAHDGIWFKGQGHWADFDYDQEEQLIEHMRTAYKKGPQFNNDGLLTAKEFSWENAAKKLIELI